LSEFKEFEEGIKEVSESLEIFKNLNVDEKNIERVEKNLATIKKKYEKY